MGNLTSRYSVFKGYMIRRILTHINLLLGFVRLGRESADSGVRTQYFSLHPDFGSGKDAVLSNAVIVKEQRPELEQAAGHPLFSADSWFAPTKPCIAWCQIRPSHVCVCKQHRASALCAPCPQPAIASLL